MLNGKHSISKFHVALHCCLCVSVCVCTYVSACACACLRHFSFTVVFFPCLFTFCTRIAILFLTQEPIWMMMRYYQHVFCVFPVCIILCEFHWSVHFSWINVSFLYLSMYKIYCSHRCYVTLWKSCMFNKVTEETKPLLCLVFESLCFNTNVTIRYSESQHMSISLTWHIQSKWKLVVTGHTKWKNNWANHVYTIVNSCYFSSSVTLQKKMY